ncbi:autotransporter outer membrane beta-barrel domain-containing protein [Pantoea septica]|uniref:autotransporter outer membrane beta-barrel domain-containing protein n=1 Tax=Pantoea septica TaxID=472695 RepID=UPI0028D58746|nr:autotransporter outer membrane beta-barrel domain-containing protein [Pantoea septica]
MFKLNPLLLSLAAAPGLLFPITCSQAATLKPFSPLLNDNKAGVFCVCNGSTQTLSGIQRFQPGLDGGRPITIGELLSGGRIISDDNVIGADRLTFGAQDYLISVPDVNGSGNNQLAVFDSANISALASVTSASELPDYYNVNGEQYIDARVAQVSNGTINVDIGVDGAATTAATNGWSMAAKQSQLFTASGSGAMNWQSANRITFTGSYTEYTYNLAHWVDNVAQYSGPFSVTTLDGNSREFNVGSLNDLRQYNDWLIEQLQSGNLSAGGYNGEFNKALSLYSAPIAYVIGADEYDDEVTLPVGERSVLSADGPGASVSVQKGATLEVVDSDGGAVRATNGAKATIDGKLAASGSAAHENTALRLAGASGVNNGVINGGFFNNADGSGVDAATLGYSGTTVLATGGSRFVNNGVLNYATTQPGSALRLSDAQGINNGAINLGVAESSGSHSSAGVLLDTSGASFINTASGEIYVGRAPQNAKSDVVEEVAINQSGGVSAIAQQFNSTAINDGRIVLGSRVQNAAAMRVENGPEAIALNNGTIDLNGRAQFRPAESVGLLAIDSGSGGLVGNNGTINLNGDGGTGIKVIARDGQRASAFSSGAINVTGRADTLNGSFNTAVWVNGQGGGKASATLSGPIVLQGNGAVGIRAEGNATVDLAADAVPQLGGSGEYQMGFLAIGPNARINLPQAGNYATGPDDWYATIFRYQDGADFDGAGLTLSPGAAFSTGIEAVGEGSVVNTHGATFNIGNTSTGLRIEGGAQGTIDAATQLNLNVGGATAAVVDGNYYNLTRYITNSFDQPFASTLVNHANINGQSNQQIGLIAQYRGALINTGDISLRGEQSYGIQALVSGQAVNSGTISVSDGAVALYAASYPFDSPSGGSVIASSGALNVTAGSADGFFPTTGLYAMGGAARIEQDGVINLYGGNALAGEALYGGALVLGQQSRVVFHDPNQTAYRVVEGGGTIYAYGSNQDVSTDGSTLYQLGDGAILSLQRLGEITLSGANTTGVKMSGSATLYDNETYFVNGKGAVALRASSGAYGDLGDVWLNGDETIGAISENGDGAVFSNRNIIGSGKNVTALQASGGATVMNNGTIILDGENSTGARLLDGGRLINNVWIHVASGIGIDASEGAGLYQPYNGTVQVDGGIAGARVGESATLNIEGDQLFRSGIWVKGGADAVLLDRGAAGLQASEIILSAEGGGSAINNRAETANIALDNAYLITTDGPGIRSATSFDYGGKATIDVQGSGVGYLFQNEDGSATANDLVVPPGYAIIVNGSGDGIRANTTGRVFADGFIAVGSEAGGSAIVTRSASEVINRGTIVSYSRVAPVIDLRGGQTVFINQGDISAEYPETPIVAGGATNDQLAFIGGSVIGEVDTGNGSDTLAVTGGTLNGSLTMGSGANNQALIENVSLANTRHITTAGGAGSTLSFRNIDASGGSFSGDDLSKGVNLGAGWSTLNFTKTQWTLTDDLKLAHSTINIDRDSTLFAGNNVNPLLAGATDDSLVVNNAGTLDLSNGGAANNLLTIDGTLASLGGTLRLATRLSGAGGQSDALRVNGDVAGTTLIDDRILAGSAATQSDASGDGQIDGREGISLAQVFGNASADSFVLQNGYLAAGPWQYGLYAFAPDGSGAGWDYRLANRYICEDGALCQPQAGRAASRAARPALAPQVPSYLSAPVGLAYYTQAITDDLHKRLGELRDGQRSGAGGELFLRYLGSNLTYQSNRDFSDYGFDADIDYSAVQLGGNLLQLDGTSDSLRGGVAYTRGNTRIRPHAADGFSSTTFDSDSVSFYGIWQRDSGFYLDGSLSWSWHRGDTDVARQKEGAKLKADGWSASLESGYPFVFANGLRLEPQAQLTWMRLKFDGATDKDSTTVNFNDDDQTIGRLGARLDRTWLDDAQREYTPYLRANYSRGWGGGSKVKVGAAGSDISQDFNSGRFGQMWDVGVGGTTRFRNDVSLYAEADYRKEIDGNGAKGWRYNAGVRWTF